MCCYIKSSKHSDRLISRITGAAYSLKNYRHSSFLQSFSSFWLLSRYLAYLLFRVFVGVLVLIYRWAIIHVYVSIIAILLYFDGMMDIK